ncbi:MAG TPA: FtsX-like permease family protein [Cyclobacteriaceae bacterium]|nr:FtsX-like permease family protein [Cyclobacteriaceae bacterium]
MIRHNLKIAFRNFKRYKSSFFINLTGLSAGLACTLLIYLWVHDELKTDRFNEKDEQLFQVMKNVPAANGVMTLENTQGRLAEALAEEIPEIEYAVSIVPSSSFSGSGIISNNDVHVRAAGQYVGRDFFNVFSVNLIQGDKKKLFSDKYYIGISESLAMKLFNSPGHVLGKEVEWDHDMLKGRYVISGIFKDPPAGSTAPFDILFNYGLYLEKNPKLENWSNSDPNTYVIVRKGTNIRQLTNKISGFIKNKIPGSGQSLFLQKFSKRYLYNHFENGVQAGGRIEYVRLFSIIAIFIMVIACINFMNLFTAQTTRRLREIGIKKAFGSGRKTLIFQFMGEAVIMTFSSAMVALLIVWLFLPQLNEITGKRLALNFDLEMIFTILTIIMFVGLVAGSYPALYLSGFKPLRVLKGRGSSSPVEMPVRKILVIFQFALSVIMIVSVSVVYKQSEFINRKNLGYNRDNIICFEYGMRSDGRGDELYFQKLNSFLQEVKELSGVVNATNFRHNLINRQGGTTDVNWSGKSPDYYIEFTDLAVGFDFIETMGIEMKEGYSFSGEFGSARSTVIFNEAAIKSMGLNNPIGEVVRIWGEDREIIGVTKDFHFQSLYENIKPLFFDLSMNPRVSNIAVKIKAGREKETIEKLHKLYGEHIPGLPLEYSFLDKDYQMLYKSENIAASLMQYFAAMAILISCLGLFGLAAFMAERRNREIGIRKILGSSEFGIVYLLSRDFTKMVSSAIIIALPVSYLLVKNWLDDFAFKIGLSWIYFAGAGLAALSIAWITVSLQTIRAARINPVHCLKEE